MKGAALLATVFGRRGTTSPPENAERRKAGREVEKSRHVCGWDNRRMAVDENKGRDMAYV